MWVKKFNTANELYSNFYGVPVGTLLCGWCGFDKGHDYACPYLAHGAKFKHRGKGINTEVFLPDGKLPASDSLF